MDEAAESKGCRRTALAALCIFRTRNREPKSGAGGKGEAPAPSGAARCMAPAYTPSGSR